MWLYLWCFTKKHSVRAFIWIQSLRYILNVDPKKQEKKQKIAKKGKMTFNDPQFESAASLFKCVWPFSGFQALKG